MKPTTDQTFLLFLVLLCATSEAYKILGVFPTQWKSHGILGSSVMKQLAAAGHDVTIVSPFETNQKNVRDVILTNYPKGENENIRLYVINHIFIL